MNVRSINLSEQMERNTRYPLTIEAHYKEVELLVMALVRYRCELARRAARRSSRSLNSKDEFTDQCLETMLGDLVRRDLDLPHDTMAALINFGWSLGPVWIAP